MLLNITSATVASVLVMSEVESELYTCRGVAEPMSPEITWRIGNSNVVDGVNGVHISFSEENGETVSTLRLPSGGDFLPPFCMLTNSVSNGGVQNEEFMRLDSITGKEVCHLVNCIYYFGKLYSFCLHNFGNHG